MGKSGVAAFSQILFILHVAGKDDIHKSLDEEVSR